ncbi:Peroxidasin, partial [Brachionus plicatilis]
MRLVLISILIFLVLNESAYSYSSSGRSASNKKKVQNEMNAEMENVMTKKKVNLPKNSKIECDKSQSNVRKTTDDGFFINQMASVALNFARSDSTVQVESKFCPFTKVDCDLNYKYRSVDGKCNNLDNPLRGAANTPYKRLLPPAYEDNLETVRSKAVSGEPLPHPRIISLTISPPSKNQFERKITQVFPIFGQFFIHDSALTSANTDQNGMEIECPCESTDPICIGLEWPKNDQFLNQKCMKFTRSSATFPDFECSIAYREQLNLLSAYLDGSVIYGIDQERANQLRTFSQGLLRTSEPIVGRQRRVLNGSYLPLADDTCSSTEAKAFNCFLAGEVRTSENLALVSMHTLFMREHNRIAGALAVNNPGWTDEEIYQEARRIVIAILQHIVYSEWLPILIGEESLSPDLTKTEYYTGYDSQINPAIANEFSTAAFRFGHTLIRDKFTRYDENDQKIKAINFTDMSFKSDWAYNIKGEGIQSILRGMVTDKCKKFGSFGFELQNKLFGKIENNEFTAIDLLSANIQRGRDHGIRPYVDYVKICHGIDAKDF